MKKKHHNADCSFYSALCNERPEDGICTCGYAADHYDHGDLLYSKELQEAMKWKVRQDAKAQALLDKMFNIKNRDV